jgi:predicted nucleic acid-binding protein
MQILRGLAEFKELLENGTTKIGCLADTGFLYALAYKDDRLFEHANDIHDLLVENEIPIYSNVISRMELIDLIFRKQVTLGCIQLFESASDHSYHKPIYNILKDIRDKDTAAKRNGESFKVDEGRLKKIRKNLVKEYGITDWADFCAKYTDAKLINEWMSIEQDLGLNFVEILEGQTSDLFNDPLRWSDMVEVMGKKGLRGPDAMIVNLFDKSKFEVLITSDSDFEKCFTDPLQQISTKTILVLQ